MKNILGLLIVVAYALEKKISREANSVLSKKAYLPGFSSGDSINERLIEIMRVILLQTNLSNFWVKVSIEDFFMNPEQGYRELATKLPEYFMVVKGDIDGVFKFNYVQLKAAGIEIGRRMYNESPELIEKMIAPLLSSYKYGLTYFETE